MRAIVLKFTKNYGLMKAQNTTSKSSLTVIQLNVLSNDSTDIFLIFILFYLKNLQK